MHTRAAAHELKNLFASLQLYGVLLEETHSSETCRELLRTVSKGIHATNHLMQAAEHVGSGTVPLDLRLVFSEIQRSAEQRPLTHAALATDYPENLWIVNGQLEVVYQVLYRLVAAADALARGGTILLRAENHDHQNDEPSILGRVVLVAVASVAASVDSTEVEDLLNLASWGPARGIRDIPTLDQMDATATERQPGTTALWRLRLPAVSPTPQERQG